MLKSRPPANTSVNSSRQSTSTGPIGTLEIWRNSFNILKIARQKRTAAMSRPSAAQLASISNDCRRMRTTRIQEEINPQLIDVIVPYLESHNFTRRLEDAIAS